MRDPPDAGARVECEPANWATDEFSFWRWNEHGGYVWCNQHHCWHWIAVPATEHG